MLGGMVRVKICGITNEDDIELCVEEGADALGFVIEYPKEVPWNLSIERATELMRCVPPFVATVAVVGGNVKTILKICKETCPDVVQLHLDENERTVSTVAEKLSTRGTSVIKALRVPASKELFDNKVSNSSKSWEATAKRFLDAGANKILIDSKTHNRPAGTGETFDWKIARHVSEKVGPVILAGGLTPKNIFYAISEVRPYAVDVISSLENKWHRKVRKRVRSFMSIVRSTDDSNV